MGWKGESRRHSLARRGIKTAKGRDKNEPYRHHWKRHPPKLMEETEAMYMHNYEPTVFCDRGAVDGEPFCWIDFGDGENYPAWSQYVVVMDEDHYEVVNVHEDGYGIMIFQTDDLYEAIDHMKERYIVDWKSDAINSPFGKMLGWVEKDSAKLTPEGKEAYVDFVKKIKASGISDSDIKKRVKDLRHSKICAEQRAMDLVNELVDTKEDPALKTNLMTNHAVQVGRIRELGDQISYLESKMDASGVIIPNKTYNEYRTLKKLNKKGRLSERQQRELEWLDSVIRGR